MPNNRENPNAANDSRNELVPFDFFEKHLTIDAEWLWKQLGIKTQFKDWVNRKLLDAEYIKNKDYFRSNLSGNTKKLEYLLTIVTAIEIMIAEGSDLGRKLNRRIIDTMEQFTVEKNPFKGLKALFVSGKELYHYRTVRENLGFRHFGGSMYNVCQRLQKDFYFHPDEKTWYVTKRYCLRMAFTRTGTNSLKAIKEVQQLELAFPEQAKIEGGNHE